MPRTFTRALPPPGPAPGISPLMITGHGSARRSRDFLYRKSGGSGGGAAAEQVVLGHRGERQGLVPDLVEEDDEPVVLDAHDDARAPLAVLDRRLDRERDVVVGLGGLLLRGARRA